MAVAGLMLLGPAAYASAQAEHVGHAMAVEDGRPATSTKNIQLVDDPKLKELDILLGPIDLPAHSSHHMEQLPVQEGIFPFDMTIHGFRTHIVDREGNPVPRIVLHHVNLLDPGRRELFLPIMLRMFAASHETPAIRMPAWLFGLPVRGGSSFLALAMLHNPTGEDYPGVTVHLTIEYERTETLPVYSVAPFHLDAMYPQVSAAKAWDLPPGRSSKSWEASPAIRGLIMGLGGHVHAYATRLTLRNVTTGEVLYDVRPTIDEEGQIVDIPVLTHRGRGIGALVVPGHVYRITAEYDNPSISVIEDGGMGVVAGAFIPLEEWPAADPREALFKADYDFVLRRQGDHEERR